jgi:hypothetical protein
VSLRDKIKDFSETGGGTDLYDRYGVISNPFPSSNQTSDNPHYALGEADELAESQIATFIRDNKSQAVVVEGTQGVGKTNFLNYFEAEITDVSSDLQGYYVVRYLADPETTFDGTIRRLLQELGPDHLRKIAKKISDKESHVDSVRSQDVRTALYRLAHSENDISELMMEWLLGFRLLKAHRETLGVQFRLDTVESKTAALRDIVEVSMSADILSGIFLLLDELEKQDGVLGPRAVVRYLSAIRAIIDALPRGLFLMIAVTPDALRRYSLALPALRSRLQNRIELSPLKSVEDASAIAHFYIDSARNAAKSSRGVGGGECEILTTQQIEHCYYQLSEPARSRGDDGVRQREFLHELYMLAEQAMSSSD